MFSGHTRDLPYIRNYTEAKAHWDKTPHNPRSKKWNPMQRPLRSISQTHYRLEADNPDEYIDVMLYTTIMARYYKPDANGNQCRLYMGHHTITSKKFMRDVLDVSGPDNAARLADGTKVCAPIYDVRMQSAGHHYFPSSAEFWFDTNNNLIPELSRHTRHWQITTTDANKAYLNDTRKAWSPFLDLMMYRLPEFEAEVELKYQAGRPFSGSYIPYVDAVSLQDMHNLLIAYETPTEGQIEALVRLSQTVFNSIASKRGYDQEGFVLKSPFTGFGTVYTKYSALEKPVTAHQLRKSVRDKLEQIVNAKRRTGHVEIPQFVVEMPTGDRKVTDNVQDLSPIE